jgi:hypothetical protein
VLRDLVERMLLAFDLRLEEERWFAGLASAAHGGDVEAPDYAGEADEAERFSPDAEWMPAHGDDRQEHARLARPARAPVPPEVSRLDQVPDEELDRLAAFGINALWLIGVWERSPASRRIKQLAGNPDAAASAYAIHAYAIAHELGGEEAWRQLSERAGARGIRLASDMVPNHMGLDSPWVVEHPDWFLSRPDPPYPSYSFEGTELSSDGRVSLKLEDHYWDRSDAAVVFRRRDTASGETRFIYHGNDGTSFPWNDTAQLDFLNPAAREAVIQAILGVARRFPIIRFDAAMVLAKRHIQRLWYPEPRRRGIPSRAGHGVTRAEFDAPCPREFWREVVDRVAAEAPGTLLLAEAFWLMEGYFVRTLGMHRVYNSAFMVMLRDERNAEYRSVLRNTLEFDPTSCSAGELHEQPGRAHRRGPVRPRREVLRRRHAAGHAAGPADVRPRAGRGLRGALRHGVPARAARRASGRGTRARALAPAGATAPPPLAVRRRARVPALRLPRRVGERERGRVRVLEPGTGGGSATRVRRGARALPQPLRGARAARSAGRPPTPRSSRTAAASLRQRTLLEGWGWRTRPTTRCCAVATR